MILKYIKKNDDIINLVSRLNSHLSSKRKNQLFFLLLLMLSLSFAEAMSLASIVPLVGVFLNPEVFFTNPRFNFFIDFFNITNNEELFFSITIIFTSLIIISFAIRILFLYLVHNITFFTEADFKAKIFKYNINQSYSYHLKQSSNIVISNLMQKTSSIAIFINCILQMVSSITIAIFIVTVLLLIEPFITIVVSGIVISFFMCIFFFKRKKLIQQGKEISTNQDKVVSIFQDSIGYFSETILYSLQNIFIKKFNIATYKIAKNFSHNYNLRESPRIYLEYITLLLLVFVLIFFNQSNSDILVDIGIIAALGLGAQKILPLINRIHSSYATMKSIGIQVLNILDLLDLSKDKLINNISNETITLKDSIKLKNINFSYDPNQKLILKNINLEIKKGSNVGIKGTTGSGKTTLGHLIVGLLNPTNGQLIIDDIIINDQNKNSWQKNISIIPQTTFLHDVSITENIAIGVELKNINMDKIKSAVKLAQMSDFIDNLPEKYETRVGERGVRLSGGQRQRIAIARALYREAKIILFDEATNQLDIDTESSIMNSISHLDKEITVIFISHQISTLKNCDQIIDLS